MEYSHESDFWTYRESLHAKPPSELSNRHSVKPETKEKTVLNTNIYFLIHIFIEYDNIYIYTPRSTILTLSKCQVQHPDHHGAGILTPKILTISRSSWQTLHAFYGISYPVVGREPVAPVSQPRDSIAQRPIFCFCPDWPKDLAVGLLARGWSGGCPRLLGATHFEPMSPVAPNRQAHHLIPPLPRLFCI